MKFSLLAFGIFLFCILPVAGQDDTSIQRAKVYVIPLREDVDRYLGVFLERSLATAEKAGAQLIILEIDTFGGRVDTALEITAKIGATTWAKTVAYIPSDRSGKGVSWSAGALMAFSCSELWMAPGTSMGAAAPVYQTTEGMQAAEEKTVSAVRGQMAALAEKNAYPVNVALAMVDADVVLTEVVIDGDISLATTDEIDLMKKRGIEFEMGKIVSGAGKILTLTAGEMLRYGVSQGSVSTRDELISSYGYRMEEVIIVEKSSSDSIITILSSGITTSLLLLVGLVALYLEITSPGFGLPGTIALMAFAIVFGVGGMMGNLGALEILMFLTGFILLLLEVFIIPGFGLAGIGGIVLMIFSLVFSLQDFYWPKFDWQWTLALRNLSIVGIGFIGSIFGIGLIMIALPRASLFARLVLNAPGDPGYAGKPWRKRRETETTDGNEKTSRMEELIQPGMKGIAVTDLRPVGKIRIGDRVIVAETSGEYYDKGTQVTVLDSAGVTVVVTT